MSLATLLPPDLALPQRDALLDTEALGARLRSWLRLPRDAQFVRRRAKYRVGESLRLVIGVRAGERALTISARASRDLSVPTRSAYLRYDTDLGAVFRLFPHDRKLPALRDLTPESPALESMVGRVSRIALAAYAPEKSATLRCDDVGGEAIAYLKTYADAQAESAFATLGALGARRERLFAMPRAVALDAPRRTLALSPLRGERLDRLYGERRVRAFESLGAALASLHSLPPFPSLAPFPRLTPSRLATARDLLAHVCPPLAADLTALHARLRASMQIPRELTMVHGDVHPKNALLDHDAIALLDFDQLALADPACDLGSFLAALEYDRITSEDAGDAALLGDAFVSGYARVRALPDASRLRWHVAASLLAERGVRALSRLREAGLARLPEIVAAAHAALDAR